MSDFIKDGTGSGRNAKVGVANRLHTHSLAVSVPSLATSLGDAFNVSSELVTLTTAGESALLYIKNNEEEALSIITEFVNIGTATGSTAKGIIKFYLTPSAGTIVSDATEAQVLNRSIGNTQTLTADAYKGAEGKTFTDGSIIALPSPGGAITSEYIIPRGTSFGLSYTPATGTTSQQIQIGFLVIRKYITHTTD